MLPDAIHDEGLVTHLEKPVSADVTKPPIMTWAVLKLYETSKHLDFLYEVYEPLARWNAWWMHSNRNENGLCEYRHPFSSGLDDNPLWDQGMPIVSPDLNTYLVLQNESLSKIARLIGEEDAAERYEQQADELASRLIKHLWDDKAEMFCALHNGQPINVVTPFNLLPLLTGRLPEPMVERLVAHLTDPDRFWTPYPIPTVAASDSHFDPQQMWRGPVWINVNYFFIEALKANGRHDLAAVLRRKTLALMLRHRDIFEYYDPFTGDPPPKAAPMFGWSAALFIELAIEETNHLTR
jgi:glycogen debranching enzyme